MKIYIYSNIEKDIDEQAFEVVETKGKGHPDNICDTLAEKISANYSKYCIEKYGVILRHMIDKLSVLGGGSKVKFGGGEMIAPIRMLVNGRFTDKYMNEKIDYMKIVTETIKNYYKELFPLLDVDKYLVIFDNTHHNEGPGVVYNPDNTTNNERQKFFEAVDKKDSFRHNNFLRCNDTSTTVSYYPISKLEKIVLKIETTLNSEKYKNKHLWVGSDIKVMGIRREKNVDITCCVPLISKYVASQEDYIEKLKFLKKEIRKIIKSEFNEHNIKININTRDNFDNNDLYLTVIGSAVESGDEGAVGRGNRSRGVIPFSRNFSMEASCGKNPVYHTGKLFAAIGNIISEEIYKELNIENVVYCTSKMGDLIIDPWNISVKLNKEVSEKEKLKIKRIIRNIINDHKEVTNNIILGNIKLNSY